MATTNTYHARMGIVDSSGNVNIIYPQTYANDVVVETGSNTYLSSNSLTTMQLFANKVGTDISSLNTKINDLQSSSDRHRVYRGDDLTSLGITEIANRIQNGFKNLYIGDYFTISMTTSKRTEDVTHVIADFDTFYGTGTNKTSKHHAVIVPLNAFTDPSQMNTTNTTAGGYVGSYMYKTTLPIYATGLANSLGGHLLQHKSLLSDAVNSSGKSSSASYYDVTLELLPEMAVFVKDTYGNSYDDGNFTDFRIDGNGSVYKGLCIFNLKPDFRIAKNGNGGSTSHWWLRSVYDAHIFDYVYYDGGIGRNYANIISNVRPCYLIS